MDRQPEDAAFDIAVDFAPAPDPQPAAAAPDAEPDSVAASTAEPAPAEEASMAAGPSRLAAFGRKLPLLLAGLGIFSGLIATIGLIIVSHNVAEANQRIAALQDALDHAPAAAVAARPVAPVHRAAPVAVGQAGTPASTEDIRALLYDFRKDLVEYQNRGGNAAWVNTMRDGQAELANRLNIVAEKVDRIDRRINGNRPASPGDDRARPF